VRNAWAAGVLVTLLLAPVASASTTPPSVRLVSHASSSSSAGSNTGIDHYAISGNGRYIAYRADPGASTANLVGSYVDDSGGESQIFLYDTHTGSNVLVSHKAGANNETGDGFAQAPTISDDGSFVLYESTSSDLVTGQSDGNGGPDVFLYDVAGATNTLVSHSTSSTTQTGNARSAQFSVPMPISSDGTKVAFRSEATDLIASFDDNNGSGFSDTDLYYYDRRTGAISLITHDVTTATDGSDDDPMSDPMVMSGDGTKVAYGSLATNLVASFNNTGAGDNYYVWNAASGVNTLVTRAAGSASEGGDNIDTNQGLQMSTNGSRIVYASDADNLVSGFVDGNGSTNKDVYVYNVGTKATTLVSHHRSNKKKGGDGASADPFISASGKAIAYDSQADDLVAPFTDGYVGQPDIFRWRLKKSRNSLVTRSVTSSGSSQNGISTLIGLSADGAHVFFETAAPDAIANFVAANTATYQAYIFNAGTHRSTLASHSTDGTHNASNGNAYFTPSSRPISDNGSAVVFTSGATDLVPSYTNNNGGADDLYRFGP
jgi:hypothetical protein